MAEKAETSFGNIGHPQPRGPSREATLCSMQVLESSQERHGRSLSPLSASCHHFRVLGCLARSSPAPRCYGKAGHPLTGHWPGCTSRQVKTGKKGGFTSKTFPRQPPSLCRWVQEVTPRECCRTLRSGSTGCEMHQCHHTAPCLLGTVVLAPELLSRISCMHTVLPVFPL